MCTQEKEFSLYITNVNTGTIVPVCTYFLSMNDIILVGDNSVMLLS